MSEAGKAVFLSYASQDAEAAKRICDALRAAGLEVWFDQSELRGGDSWDAKIRKQIKECALFVPIISANTQARGEGYFRLEWKLAVDRSHLMADDSHFLFPVVIDDTPDAGARVPEKFHDVQWTRLNVKDTPETLALRVGKLLGGSLEAGRPRPAERGEGAASPRKYPPWMRNLGMITGLAIGLIYAVRPLFLSSRRSESKAAAVAPAAPSETAQLTARAYAITQKVGFTREELATAEALSLQAVTREPGSARAQSVRAWVQACYLMRNWDVTERRLQEVQASANRALALDAGEADALNALASVLEKQRAAAEVEKITRRAVVAAPGNYRSWMLLGRALRSQGKKTESREVLQEAVRRFPDNVLCRYDLASDYVNIGTQFEVMTPAGVTAALEQIDAAIAIQPFASAILMKAVLAASGRGDLGTMRAELDQLESMPLSDRSEDRAVYVAMWAGLLERQPERVLAAAKLSARPYFEDSIVAAPKAWSTALAYRLAGKDALARQEWSAAEVVLRQRLREQPNDWDTVRLATTLAWQGDNEGAERLVAPVEAVWREDPSRVRARDLARYYAARGDAAKAVLYLRTVVNFNSFLTDHVLPLDPWWDKLRGQPEFEALLKEAPGRGLVPSVSVAPKADEKSVAVLAFANLSDDKANEYFSDGISEELLNVLAKVAKLKVAARTSSFYFKGRNEPIPEIAQKLGVAYVVEGSVRKAGNKVRITAQLIKAADGFHVWSETYDRDLTDIFAVQDEIAKNILGIVKGSLLGEAELPHATTTKTEAYALFLQAQGQLAIRGEVSMLEAERLFVAALAIDPDYVPALVGLARTRFLLPIYVTVVGAKARLIAEQAKQAAQHALELDPRNAEALAAHGSVLAMSEWRWAEGEAELLRARELAPNDAWVANLTGDYFTFTGNVPAALAAKRQMQELDPLSAVSHWDLGFAHLLARDYDQAIRWGERAMQLAPTLLSPYVVSVLAAGRAGRFDLMRQTLAKARRDCREADGDRLLLEAYGAILEKRPDEAQRILALVTPRVEKGEVAPAFLGYCYLLLGDSDRARTWLQRGYELHDPQLTWSMSIDFADIAANPKTRPLLELPGLKELYEIRLRNARAGATHL